MQRIAVVASAGGLAILSGPCGTGMQEQQGEARVDQARRGEYLVGVLGCDDCHTPKKMTPRGPAPDPEWRLAGHRSDAGLAVPALPPEPRGVVATMDLTAWSGPRGVSYAINITPDEDTGMGIRTEEMFVKAMRTGRHMVQSRPILPPMPWMDYARLTDEDLQAVFASLRVLPPIGNRVPEPVSAPPPGSPAG